MEIQEYLLEGNENTELTEVSKLIYKCRGKTLDIKTHKSWKYEDKLCVGCNTNVETETELLSCDGFGNEEEDQDTLWTMAKPALDGTSVDSGLDLDTACSAFFEL